MRKPKYITKLEQIPQLSARERERLRPVVERYAFRANDYYVSLIDWDDPDDPIRRIAIPDELELDAWGEMDASHESAYTKAPGLEHKYEDTAVLLVNDVCGAYCRFCFRKRLFMNGNDEVSRDLSGALAYIREHPEVNNVLLTGGDPLLLSTNKLRKIIAELREIEHVKIVRIGSKMPAFNPFRILGDPSLLEMFERYSAPERKIYLMAHFNHPRELTGEAVEAMHRVQRAGVVVCNQTPMVAGVNDDPLVLAELFDRLSFLGIPPYYVFIGRPTKGNRLFAVPVERAYDIFEQARMNCSGLAKRARLAMSHATGKIEIVARTDEQVFFRYHRAADQRKSMRLLVYPSNPDALWFDDYAGEPEEEYVLENPFLGCGMDA